MIGYLRVKLKDLWFSVVGVGQGVSFHTSSETKCGMAIITSKDVLEESLKRKQPLFKVLDKRSY